MRWKPDYAENYCAAASFDDVVDCANLLTQLDAELAGWLDATKNEWSRVLNLVKHSTDSERMLKTLQLVTNHSRCRLVQHSGRHLLTMENPGHWYAEIYRTEGGVGLSIWAPNPTPIKWLFRHHHP